MKRHWRKKLDQPETIDAILARAGEDRFSPTRPPIAHAVWRAAVGPRIADQTVPLSLEGRVLLVRASSSTWASELSMLSETIISRLRQHGVDVERLVFRTGPIERPARPPERRRTREVPAPVPLPKALARDLDGVGDDELRSAIAKAASRALAFEEDRAEANESRRGARGPRSAETESAPPDRTARADRGAAPRTPAGARGRSR